MGRRPIRVFVVQPVQTVFNPKAPLWDRVLNAISLIPFDALAGATLRLGARGLECASRAAEALRGAEETASEGGEILRFYHGTNTTGADAIRGRGIGLSQGRPNLDFNPAGQRGFYVTQDFRQAAARARSAVGEHGGDPVVLQFEVPNRELAQLNGLTFDSAGSEWAQFVSEGRQGTLSHQFDYVEGPVLRNPEDVLQGLPAEPFRGGGGHQLGIFSQDAADLFNGYLVP